MEYSDKLGIIDSRPGLAERFKVVKVLGQGAAGIVYHALDRARGDRPVALKILVNEGAFDENTLLRFHREFEICKEIRHPNLVAAYDSVEAEGLIAFTMEYIDGRDLGSIMNLKRFPLEEIDGLMAQLLSALAELHSHRIVHRDVKLENILLGKDGVLKLADLGLMKSADLQGLTRTGILLGTAQYLPPEYVQQSQFDHRGDLYAAGIVLFELLTGTRRLAHKQGNEALQYLIRSNFKLSRTTLDGIPARYLPILDRSACPEPDARYQSAEEMRAEFLPPEERERELNEVRARSADAWETTQKFQVSSLPMIEPSGPQSWLPGRLALCAMVSALLLVMGVASFLTLRGPARERIYEGVVTGLHGGSSEKLVLVGTASAYVLRSPLEGCPSWHAIEGGSEIVCERSNYRIVVDREESAQITGAVVVAEGTGNRRIPFNLPRAR